MYQDFGSLYPAHPTCDRCMYHSSSQTDGGVSGGGKRYRSSNQTDGEVSGGGDGGKWKWFGIPWGLGVACLAALQLLRIFRREREKSVESDPITWQVFLLPSVIYKSHLRTASEIDISVDRNCLNTL